MLRFTATVKKREVVVSGVDLPDGAQVDVTIDPSVIDDVDPEWDAELEALIEADCKQSEREFRRGEYYRGEDFMRWLRGGPRPVLVRDQPGWTASAQRRREKLVAAAREAKPAPSRSRKRAGVARPPATPRKRSAKR